MESMTGFGRAIFQGKTYQIMCQAKSLNHRFLEITLKLPKRYALLEEKIRKVIAETFQRGKIEVQIRVLGLIEEEREILFDLELAKNLKRELEKLKETLSIPGEITLSEILTFKEITLLSEKEEDLEALWKEIELPLKEALRDLKEARLKEGLKLKEKIYELLKELEMVVSEIDEKREKMREENIEKMRGRVETLLKELGFTLDEGRLYQEIAFLLERMDITEEVERLKIHLRHAFSLLEEKECGKKLDFLCQEMLREINTLSNKAQSAEISLLAVKGKDLIEKIREQVQNVV